MNTSFCRATYRGLKVVAALWCLSVVLSAGAFANSDQMVTDDSPHALIERLTHEVLSLVQQEKALLDTDPDKFYSSIKQALQPVVAFDYIANGVMGNYARQATPEQRARFSEAFQNNLISTYAKGMALYADQRVEIIPPEEALGERTRISVVQKIYGADSDHMMIYSMGKSRKDNQWKLLNVIINGVNLGNTFRSQFQQAMKQEGDIDRVIDNWAS